jgi:hypothetical protein
MLVTTATAGYPLGAGFRGIAWVNQEYLDTGLLCFVRDVLAQLRERPTVVPPALLMLNRCSASDMCQILQRECLAFPFSFGNQGFCYAMVGITLKSMFLLGQLFQSAFRVLRTTFLQSATVLMIPFVYLVNVLTAEGLSVALGSHVDDTQIASQNTGWFIRIGRFFGLRDVHIPHGIPSYQFSTANLPGEVIQGAPLEVAQVKLTDDTTADGIERHLIALHQAVGTRVVADAASSSKRWTGGMVMLASRAYRFRRLISGTARQLCTKAKLRAGRAIDQAMQRVFIRNALLPRNLRTVGCRSVEGGLRSSQGRISRRVNTQFTAYGTCGESIAHIPIVPSYEHLYNYDRRKDVSSAA